MFSDHDRQLFVSKDRSMGVIPVHPFVNSDHRAFRDQLREVAKGYNLNRIGFLDVYEFERQPIGALQRLRQMAS